MLRNILWMIAILVFALPGRADNYPDRPITMVIPAPPGGGLDVLARTMAEEMGKQLKQTVLVDNKPGGGGVIALQSVARAPADGYTVLLAHSTPISYLPNMMSKLPYDVLRDFAFITELSTASLVMTVGRDVPATTPKEFVAWARKNPGKANYGSYGIGSASHLMGAYLSDTQKLGMEHVAYKGEALMVQDLVAGQIPMGMSTTGVARPFILSGQVRPLAIMGPRRVQALPEVPTMAETGFPGAEYYSVSGVSLLAPSKVPPDVLARLEAVSRAAVHSTAMKARFQIYGMEGVGGSGADARRAYKESQPLIQKLVKISGVKLD